MKRPSVFALLFVILIAALVPQRVDAISFNLDSIAAWGKFPRFCVNTYRWGDKFFNGYDTAYVNPTGYKFNVKLTTDSWIEAYNFQLPNHTRIFMTSDNSTSAGLYLTYLAESLDSGASIVFRHIKLGCEEHAVEAETEAFARAVDSSEDFA